MTDTTTQAALPAPDYIDPDGGAEYWERAKMRAYATQYAASLTAERDELRAQVEALRADAERYRFLKDYPLGWHIEHERPGRYVRYAKNEIDAAIDAARKEGD